MRWQPSMGAWPAADGTRFRVWAPTARRVEVVPLGPGSHEPLSLEPAGDGFFQGTSPRFRAGDRYGYLLDGEGPFPDPASRSQPEGVHGPSEVVDPHRFPWSDEAWAGLPRDDLVLYELHLGAFTPEGTFAGAMERLADLARLGVNAVQLMPVADFPGRRNWGYDGVDIFAPARCYGTPDDFRRLVDRAHALGLAVLLDVVYNHFGPDGNVLPRFSPWYISERHRTPWGPAVNLDGPASAPVRAFFVENALHWIHEYHLDGLRLDATHALVDEGPRHFLAELGARVHASSPGRHVHLIAEDHRNLAAMLRPESSGGWGLDGVWSDDFHHQVRRLLAGDVDGVYRDFRGTVPDLVATLNRGWLFCGEYSIHRGRHRGTDPSGINHRRFVFFIQNHDRIGNRALGERLHHQIDPAAYRAASVLLLVAPETPLLFMGQEWGARSPFLFFTDHAEELGRQVREGRRHEFRHYPAFRDPATLDRIPDPQDEATFLASKLDWSERDREPAASLLRLYTALLRLRRGEPALGAGSACEAVALDDATLLLRHDALDGSSVLAVVRLRGAGLAVIDARVAAGLGDGPRPEVLLTTEDPAFAPDPAPPVLDLSGPIIRIGFARPGGVVLRRGTPRPG